MWDTGQTNEGGSLKEPIRNLQGKSENLSNEWEGERVMLEDGKNKEPMGEVEVQLRGKGGDRETVRAAKESRE